MCIIIDVNAIPSVFNAKVEDHDEFDPVRRWIVEGKGKMVFGGSKYNEELRHLDRYRRIIRLLSDQGKVVRVSNELVDQEQARLEQTVSEHDFDDPHLIAIAIISACKLICTHEKRACKYIRDNKLYPKKGLRPSIYSRRSHTRLLSNRNIAKCCDPADENRELKRVFKSLMNPP